MNYVLCSVSLEDLQTKEYVVKPSDINQFIDEMGLGTPIRMRYLSVWEPRKESETKEYRRLVPLSREDQE